MYEYGPIAYSGPGTQKLPITVNCAAHSVLTITLSGGTTIQPWHKKFDKNHDNSEANLSYKAIVTNQNGQPQANIAVKISTDVTANSGGHNHTDGRSKGRLEPGTQVSTLNSGSTIVNAVTDVNGVFAFTFGSEEASGTHTITANCTGCAAQATAAVDVSVQGLMQLDADPKGYTLTGDKPEHPDNHYFSPAAMVKIINLTLAYQRKFHHPLIINDSSLVKGGVFDIEKDWTYKSNKHGGHRMGVVVDINNYTINPTPPCEQFPSPRFVDFAATYGIKADPHPSPGHPMGTAPHYHLLLLGAGHDQ
jgi:hypothetical protein